ncbi:DNA polymerase III subunit delta [Roseinatronobacter monicus]|uniref:DNA-directed DNA polymerase n=1 Tax=Roseinatronobacter monicus TaxID=393481 RepID=A0A543KGR4_9RHOB|nr:DNA polymerase III subunit delta [Roseinatronobacter monicus]TQM94269.1 DNA polymerase III delta subunit [Roseinatronobacter monicus]
MKFNARDLARLIAKPDPQLAGVLIYGQDAMRVALKRQELVAAMIGPQGETEMRLDRMPASDLRRGGAALLDAVKAQGFFPGPRVVLIEDATDIAHDAVAGAVKDWRAGDAQLVVTAGALKATSKLRKLFEGAKQAGAVALYDDPPSREEIEAALHKAGLTQIDTDAMRDLVALSRALDPGDFRQTLEKIALYKHGDPTPLCPEDIAAVAPSSTEAVVDDLLHAVAEGQSALIGPLLVRLQAQGVQAVTLAIMAMRHFRSLHAMSCHPGGPSAGIQRLRPPIFGPRRDRLLGQAQSWGLPRLERALTELIEADLTLRSASNAPSMAVMERALIRLAMLVRR